MNRYDFLKQLEEQLQGSVSNQELRDSIQYYREYIEDEMRKGKTEEEVLAFLGTPNGIAKSIIDAKGSSESNSYEDSFYGRENRTSYGYDPYGTEDYDSRQETTPNMKVFQLDGWKGKLVVAGIFFVLFLILVLLFKVAAFLLPFVLPFLLILCLVKWLTNRR